MSMQTAGAVLNTKPVLVDVDVEKERVDTAFSKLGIREPFIAAVMTRVKRIVIDDPKFPTAATNGEWVKFNPNFTAECSDPQLFGLVLHESLHVVFMHMWRRDGRHPGLWNYANDAIINKYIINRGYELPDGGVMVNWVKEDMDSEFVYDKLKQDEQDKQQQQSDDGAGDEQSDDCDGNSGGSGSSGDEQGDGLPKGGWNDSGDLEDAETDASKSDMEATIIASAEMAKQCGQGSSIIDRILENVGKASVNWADVCRDMMTASARNDFTFSRPSRRHLWNGLYMPSLHSEGIGPLLVGFDTSASVSQSEADQIAAEVTSICMDLQPEFVEVVYCTTKIVDVQRFYPGEPIELNVKGTGGTSFAPVFKHLEESHDRFAGFLYFTDMGAPLSGLKNPGIPMVWADTYTKGKTDVPFGVIVPVTVDAF